jgi:hypothetical protein
VVGEGLDRRRHVICVVPRRHGSGAPSNGTAVLGRRPTWRGDATAALGGIASTTSDGGRTRLRVHVDGVRRPGSSSAAAEPFWLDLGLAGLVWA